MYQYFFKRLFDLLASIILLPLLGIIIMGVAPLIWLEDRGSIFYMAKRRGLHGRIFDMYKFRSMKMNAPDYRNKDNSTYNAPDDPRITKVGKVLRKFSIDEIPQILNVIKGDMSIIGPRPITINRPLSEYDEKRRVRLQVKPGITGYTQAYFRNAINQEKKLEYDAEYAKSVSFVSDFKIFIQTIITVLRRKNIYNTNNSNDI